MVKDGKALEQLVGIIDQVDAGNENVTVEPEWLVDKVTGDERQQIGVGRISEA